MKQIRMLVASSGLALVLNSVPALAQSETNAAADETAGVGEIIVTAQKREQRVNDVGMSIAAISGDDLAQRGITSPSDLSRAVTGFTATPSEAQTPIYTLRGVGFFDHTLSSSPAVSVYVDEAALPYPVMGAGATLDVSRVEVLKGPQGTLFGQNSTGGAINFVAAKPTDRFEMGVDVTHEARFGETDASAFVSGPVTGNLNARLALRAVQGGSWQRSTTRDDRLGDDRKQFGRLLLDWQPTARLSVSLNLNGFIDRSDTQAGQLNFIYPTLRDPRVRTEPFPDDARSANWDQGFQMRRDDKFYQGVLRADYEITDSVKLTSISNYSRITVDGYQDYDGTASRIIATQQYGEIESFNQEVRLSGSTDTLQWIVGANYGKDAIFDGVRYEITDNSVAFPFGPNPLPPFPPSLEETSYDLSQDIETYAAFGNLEYELTDALKIQAGARYTKFQISGNQCGYDRTPGQALSRTFEFLEFLIYGSIPRPIQAGQCVVLDRATFLPVLEGQDITLDQDNISWRAGINYKTPGGTLLYANQSRGYKSGGIGIIGASFTDQFDPVVQEQLDASEVGFKAPLLDRMLQLNAAAFYYKYKDKQIRGAIVDPVFGTLEKLINVPKSTLWGMELQVAARPVPGLDINGGISYIESEIKGPFNTFNKAGVFGDFGGSNVPYTPKVTANFDIQYSWDMSNGISPFVGASVDYKSRANSTFVSAADRAAHFAIPRYATLDLRAGVSGPDDAWRVSIFGRNITDKYYWTGVITGSDTTTKFAGMPATYGITLSARIN